MYNINYNNNYRIIDKILFPLKMDIAEYKKLYGEYVSDEYKNKVSNKSKYIWKNLDGYRDNIILNAARTIFGEKYKIFYSVEDFEKFIKKQKENV